MGRIARAEMSAAPVRLAVAQLRGSTDRAENIASAARAIARAVRDGAELILLHELLNTDYFCPDESPSHWAKAEPVPGPTSEELARLAQRYGVYVVAGLAEKVLADGQLRNSAIAIAPNGRVVAHYYKMHMGSDEARHFRVGELACPVFAGPRGLRCGILICYDRHFPEVPIRLARAGAHLLLIPATSARESWTYEIWLPELRAIATLNRVYVAASNRVGPDKGSRSGLTFFGRSAVIDPAGDSMAVAPEDTEEILVATIDPSDVARWRHSAPRVSPVGSQLLCSFHPQDADEPHWTEALVLLARGLGSRNNGSPCVEASVGDVPQLRFRLSEDGSIRFLVSGGNEPAVALAPSPAVHHVSGVRLGVLSPDQLRRPEYWRALAIRGVQLVLTFGLMSSRVTFAELQYLAISTPCYVLATAEDGAGVWIRPDGRMTRLREKSGPDARMVMLASDLVTARERTELVVNRRTDLLTSLFAGE